MDMNLNQKIVLAMIVVTIVFLIFSSGKRKTTGETFTPYSQYFNTPKFDHQSLESMNVSGIADVTSTDSEYGEDTSDKHDDIATDAVLARSRSQAEFNMVKGPSKRTLVMDNNEKEAIKHKISGDKLAWDDELSRFYLRHAEESSEFIGQILPELR
jgi:hypothetical protein